MKDRLRVELHALLASWRAAENAHSEMADMIQKQTGREDTRQRGYSEMLLACIKGVENTMGQL